MMNYIIYKSDFGDCIVEIFNEGEQEMLSIQQSLTQQGYIITDVCGLYIKCHKVNEGTEN